MSTASPSDPVFVHVTSMKLTADDHAALKRIAAADKRSLSNELRYLIARRDAELADEPKAA